LRAEGPAALKRRLADFGPLEDNAFPPLETALLVAALDRPGHAVEPYRAFLTGMAEDIRAGIAAAGTADAVTIADLLLEVLVRRHRFRSDDRDDDDIANASLMNVIDTKCGVSDLLSLLLLGVARQAGLAVDGLAFPVRLLLRLEDQGGRRVILDPGAGMIIGPPEMRSLLKAATGVASELEPAHYAALGSRPLLVRLQSEVKLRLLRAGRVQAALKVVETMLLFAPDLALLWREAGLMHMRLDNIPGAVAALEQFAARTPNAQARARTRALLAELKGRLS